MVFAARLVACRVPLETGAGGTRLQHSRSSGGGGGGGGGEGGGGGRRKGTSPVGGRVGCGAESGGNPPRPFRLVYLTYWELRLISPKAREGKYKCRPFTRTRLYTR